MDISIQNLANTFAVLDPHLNVHLEKVTPSLYANLDKQYNEFKGHVLLSMHEFSADWPTWERHPAGDELVLLLSGAAEFVFRDGSSDHTVELSEPGTYVVVPRNTWHTARVSEPTRMLFMTPGEGTENEEQPGAD